MSEGVRPWWRNQVLHGKKTLHTLFEFFLDIGNRISRMNL